MPSQEYEWSASLDVGNEKMNSEHRELLRRMAQIEELNTKTLNKQALAEAYLGLIDFVHKHFREEEEHMKAMRYPQLETHQRIHESMLDALMRYYREFEASVYGRFPSSVFDFFKTWVLTHIMMVDRQYAEFEKSKDSSSAASPRKR